MAKNKEAAYKAVLAELGAMGYDTYSDDVKLAAYQSIYGEEKGAEQAAQGSPAADSLMSGAKQLAMAYANDGKISAKEAKQIGTSTAMKYGSKQGYSLMGGKAMSTGQAATYSGAYAGAASLASDYAAGRDLDYTKAGWAGAKGYGKTYAKQYVSNQFGKSAGQNAGAFMAIAQAGWDYQKAKADADNYYQWRAAKTYGKAEMFGKSAGAIMEMGGAKGASQIGGVMGSLYAADRYRPKDTMIYQYADPENKAVRFNPQTGKFEATEAVGMRKFKTHLGVALGEQQVTEEELAHLNSTQEVNQNRANILNERIANFDKLDAAGQLEVQGIVSGQIDPTFTEEIRNKHGEVILGTSQVDVNRGRNYQFKDWRAGDTGQYTATKGLYNRLQEAQGTGTQLTQKQQQAMTDYERVQGEEANWQAQLERNSGTNEHMSFADLQASYADDSTT